MLLLLILEIGTTPLPLGVCVGGQTLMYYVEAVPKDTRILYGMPQDPLKETDQPLSSPFFVEPSGVSEKQGTQEQFTRENPLPASLTLLWRAPRT